jgi:Ca-activated chloride channel family protein
MGKYVINAKKGETLVFSFVGMQDKEIKVENATTINVILKEGGMQLNEVVLTDLGIKRKREPVNSNQTEMLQSNQVLSGKVAGLQITHDRTSGNVVLDKDARPLAQNNSTSRIVLRGSRSTTGNSKALVVIDNKVVSAETLQNLNPAEIEKTNVIKGAQGAALYGSAGANGVIIVTTKSSLANGIVPVAPVYLQDDYESFVENSFESPKNAPLSTFSIDVDNASYTNVRRFINNGQTVPKDAVRVEEMINFFKYQYPQPKDNHPFSINTEYSESPWNPKHKLLKIGLQGKIIPTDDLPASNLVFLIDVSGSMNSPNRLPLLVQSMKILVKELRNDDRVSIVVYAGAAGLVLPPTSGGEKQTIIDALEKLTAGGSTAGGAGIELAYKIAGENFVKGGNNRVILATDGDFNIGSSSNMDMQSLIEEKRKSGVFLTCLGYGMGNYKDSKMEILANKGNGNYAYIDNIQEANRFLGKEFKGSMFAIAKDVKIQIEFNPKHVQSYRLIGYENRKLHPEDFTNDVIDAGELGSGHTVTALYEIIPVGIESKFSGDMPALKYSKTESKPSEHNNELATVKFRYKKPDGDKSTEMVEVIDNKTLEIQNASEDLKFSAAVAWFGLKLRDSKLVDNKSSADIKMLAVQGMKYDSEGYRAEFIRLVESVN